MCDFLENVDGHHALFLLRNSLSLPKLLYFLQTTCCFKEKDLLHEYDKLIVSALFLCANNRLNANSQLQSLLPSSSGGLGLTSVFHLALPTFLASAVGCGSLTQTILSKFDIGDDAEITLAFTSWSSKTGLQNVPSNLSFRSLGQLRFTKCCPPIFLIVLTTLVRSVFCAFRVSFLLLGGMHYPVSR